MMPECQEYFGAVPFSSDHVWPSHHRYAIPEGRCLKCGLHIVHYNERSYRALMAMPDEVKFARILFDVPNVVTT